MQPTRGGRGFAAPFLKAEDSTQTSGLEKPNARHGPTASADPGEPSGLLTVEFVPLWLPIKHPPNALGLA